MKGASDLRFLTRAKHLENRETVQPMFRSAGYHGCVGRNLSIIAVLLLAGCQSGTYLRDGVTDGDTFYLAPAAYASDDPAVASWVRYSLIRSTCQLEVRADNPARVSRYSCESVARRHLVEAWLEQRKDGPIEDAYLDALVAVQEAGFLGEYTAYYFAKPEWRLPETLDLGAFDRWRREHLRRHRPQTRLVGYWGFRNPAAPR